ncbi:hypothetical protein [Congregibacter sp.]|uniref:hypothetical protein n=1 Tax=Congregibacter sp. TaxID=2744308 RepID=UPI003F6CC651
MSSEYSSDGFFSFLRETALAGRMPPAVARSRRAAAETLFEKLSEQESQDLRGLDIDELKSRFLDIQGSGLRAEVVDLYAARVRGALDDYFRFVNSPSEFVSISISQDTARPRSEASARTTEERALETVRMTTPSLRPDVIPIPLERGRVVYLHEIPSDLTPQEAAKISRILKALVGDPEDEQ